MKRRGLIRIAAFGSLAATGLPAMLRPSAAQTLGGELDVPYVDTPQSVVDAMLELAAVGPHDSLLDLGSGDGRVVITAASRWGTQGLGIDNDPSLVALARGNAQRAGVADKAHFREQDLFETDLTRATVITMYLLPDVNMKLRPRLQQLRAGTRIVSHDWHMGDWAPQRTIEVPSPGKSVAPRDTSRLMLWVVGRS